MGGTEVFCEVGCHTWHNRTNYACNEMSNVISEKQRKLNEALHQERKDFGNRSDGSGLGGNLTVSLKRMNELGVCNSVLDYGTGKGRLVEKLRGSYQTQFKLWDTIQR